MKSLLLIILLLFLKNGTAVQGDYVDERTNVKILFSFDERTFPESWFSPEIDAYGVSLSKTEYDRSIKILEKALIKYPSNVVRKNLKTIYVLKEIEFYGQSFGGTNSTNIVYLSNDGINAGYTDFYLEQLFHSEFSSILLRNHKQAFDQTEWIKNNGDFIYGKSGVDALKTDMDDENFDPYYNKKGLLYQYGMSSLENDFNSFVENLFLPKDGFRETIVKHERLKNKKELTISFLNKINSNFTKEYFSKF